MGISGLALGRDQVQAGLSHLSFQSVPFKVLQGPLILMMSNYILGICIHLDQLDTRLSNAIIHTNGNIGVASFKVRVANSDTAIIWTPIFEWYVVRCGSKNGHQTDKCFEIGLCTQNMLTILGSMLNMIGDLYDHSMSTRIFICDNV